MGKRSNFERNPRDFYPTPREAVLPLLPHLGERPLFYCEPCAGDGALIDALAEYGHKCLAAYDIEPKRDDIKWADALTHDWRGVPIFITNTPWHRPLLHQLIQVFAQHAPAWILLDSDWAHTKQAAPYMKICRKIVSVGRLKWIPDSKMTGKDNCCWYLFDGVYDGKPEFWERMT